MTRKTIPELSFLLTEVEKKYGRKLSTATDFESLSVVIEMNTRAYISASTLKRLWGYVTMNPTPRISTLDILCKFIGHKDFKSFCTSLKDTSSFNSTSSERQKKEAATFVKQKMDSAKWFVEALKQRHNTLLSTMQAIVDYQHDYFIDGDESNLRPMVLKDIAAKTGFDISTISRVVNSKYIETHFGIFPLKYFFSEGLENQQGEEVSTRELKKVLQECVDNEDKHKPLTDDQLVSIMNEKGYKVARRTIAKYRDQLGIPKARLRKEL